MYEKKSVVNRFRITGMIKNNKTIKLKAAFLLMVFALNTVIAFACSIGLNMGYNQKHHHKDKKDIASAHAHRHSHDTNSPHSSHPGKKSTTNTNDCCNKNAAQFQQDKSFNQASNPIIKAPPFIAFVPTFSARETKSNRLSAIHKFIIPQYYPPPDIRIAIQSFQI